MKKIAYARVSTSEQAENQNALRQQIQRLEQEGVDEIYHDVESGTNSERPEFQRLIKEVKQGDVSVIVATRWDRLTRDDKIYQSFKSILKTNSVQLKLLDQGIVNLETASGELYADLQALFAVNESRMLKERIQKGFEYRRSRKAACGRTPWGYINQEEKYTLDTRPIVCPLEERPENYKEMKEEPDDSQKLAGVSKADIARETIDYFLQIGRPRPVLRYLYKKYGAERQNDPDFKKRNNIVLADELLFWKSGQNLAEWLKNPVLRGHTAYLKYDGKILKKEQEKWEIHQNTHVDQALITEEEFYQIKEILESNQRKQGTPGSKLFLTGLVFCQNCGYKCQSKRNAKYAYYGCRNSGIGCGNKGNVRVERIEEAVIRQLFLRAKELEVNELSQSSSSSFVPKESETLKKLKEQLAGLENILDQGQNDAIKRAKHDLEKEIQQESLKSSENSLASKDWSEILYDPNARNLIFWYTLTVEEREIIYEKLVNKIYILGQEVVEVKLKV